MRGGGVTVDATARPHGYGNTAKPGDLDTASVVDSHLALVAVAADRQDQPDPIVHEGNRLVGMFDATYPRDPVDITHRQSNAVDPARFYPLAGENRRYAIEWDAYFGREGYDWQNPYAWAARGVLIYPNPASSGLASNIGGVNMGADPSLVALNVQATSGVLDVGGFGS